MHRKDVFNKVMHFHCRRNACVDVLLNHLSFLYHIRKNLKTCVSESYNTDLQSSLVYIKIIFTYLLFLTSSK